MLAQLQPQIIPERIELDFLDLPIYPTIRSTLSDCSDSETDRYKKLWRACLTDAIQLYCYHSNIDARRWLLLDNRSAGSVGSYNWVCEVLDIDARRLRRTLLVKVDEIKNISLNWRRRVDRR